MGPPFPFINHKNNFDVLRFSAAVGVIFSHCYALMGTIEPLAVSSGHVATLGQLCVSVFFIISGFLITASWVKNPKLSVFIKNRCLRFFGIVGDGGSFGVCGRATGIGAFHTGIF